MRVILAAVATTVVFSALTLAWAQTGIAPDRPGFDPDVCVYPEACGISPPPPPPPPPGTPPPVCSCQPHEICNAGSCQAAICADGTALLPGQNGIADCCGPCADWDTTLNACVTTCAACQDCWSNTCVPRDCGAYAVCDPALDQCVSCGTCQAVNAGVCGPLTCPAGEACDMNTGVCVSGQPCAQVVNGVWTPMACSPPTPSLNTLTCTCEACPACTDFGTGGCEPRTCPAGEICNAATDQCEPCPVAGDVPDSLGNCCPLADQCNGQCTTCPFGMTTDVNCDCCLQADQDVNGVCPPCAPGETLDSDGTCCLTADQVGGLCPCNISCPGDMVPNADGTCGCSCPIGTEQIGDRCLPPGTASQFCECPQGGAPYVDTTPPGDYVSHRWYCGPFSDYFAYNCAGSNRARWYKRYSLDHPASPNVRICEDVSAALAACDCAQFQCFGDLQPVGCNTCGCPAGHTRFGFNRCCPDDEELVGGECIPRSPEEFDCACASGTGYRWDGPPAGVASGTFNLGVGDILCGPFGTFENSLCFTGLAVDYVIQDGPYAGQLATICEDAVAGLTEGPCAPAVCPAGLAPMYWRSGVATWNPAAGYQHGPPPAAGDWCGAVYPELVAGESVVLNSTENNCFGTAAECPSPVGSMTLSCVASGIAGVDPALSFQGMLCSTGAGCPAGWVSGGIIPGECVQP